MPLTKEKIFLMYKGREDKIDWEKVPPDIEDFPYDVQKALICYNKLGDRIAADIGYLGKDFGLVKILMDVEGVINKELFLETLLRLDNFFIRKSHKDMENARKQAKRGKR